MFSVSPGRAAAGKVAWGNGAQLTLRSAVSLPAWGKRGKLAFRMRGPFWAQISNKEQIRRLHPPVPELLPLPRPGWFQQEKLGLGESGIQDWGFGTQRPLSESQTDVSSFSSA